MAGEPARLAVGKQAGKTFVELAVNYGSVFSAEAMRPYDAFEFRLQVSPERSEIVQHVGISGLLTRQSLHRSARSHLVLGAFQHYDYDFVPGIKSSGNSVSAALLFQRQLGARNVVNLGAHAEGLILGGISSDQGHYSRRDFDLGPGAGARIGAGFARDGREWLRVDSRIFWLRSIHGSGGEHVAGFLRVGATLPIGRSLGLGTDFSYTTRHSRYPEWTPVTRRASQFQTYLTWSPS
jgi:hypothetical protein